MAYKFQRGEAILSGGLLQEGDVEIESGFNFKMHNQTVLDTSRNLTAASLSGSGNLLIGGTVRLDGAADAEAVAADKVMFRDADDNLIKGESFSDVRDNLIFDAVSGQADIAHGGAFSLDVSAITAQTEMTGDVADADELMISDGGVLKRLDFSVLRDAVFADVSGDAAVAAGGALTIAADSVEGTMLNTNAADGTTMAVTSDSLSVLKVPNALSQGDGITAFSYDGSGALTVALSASVAGDGLGFSSGVLSVQAHGTGGIEVLSDALLLNIDGMSALGGATIDQADTFAFSDGTTPKKVTFSNLEDSIFGNISGDATVAAGGALTIAAGAVEHGMLNDNIISGQDELAHADIADADELMISDGGVVKRVGVDSLRDHYYGSVSGDATIADGGALTIAANAVEDSMVNDNVAAGLAGVGLAAASGVMSLDLSELSDVQIASGDKLAMLDATDSSTKLESIDDIATLFAGDGLAASSAVLSLDLHELTDTAVAVGDDSFAFIDATDNSTKKESIADLVSAMAGAGLTATSGVLKVTGNDVHLKAHNGTLAEGYNYFADIGAETAAVVTLPAGSVAGDVVHVKAGDLGDNSSIQIQRAGSDLIDGEPSIYLESPFAAVSLVYVAANAWRIV